MTIPETTKSDVPLAAIDIVCEILHGEPTTSRINANYLAWKALNALQEAGYPIRWTCSGCCNCWPSRGSAKRAVCGIAREGRRERNSA